MLDRDVRPKLSHPQLTKQYSHSTKFIAFPPPLTAKNERKDARKARVFGQQATPGGWIVVVVWPGPE